MDPDFWHSRWSEGRIGFHEETPHPMLVRHVPALGLSPGAHVFVPLCGKSVDLIWLRAQGFVVTGAELNTGAVEAFFEENGLSPGIEPAGALTRYHADDITIYAGDIFDLGRDALGLVDAVYDRAALVALPGVMRARYARYVAELTGQAPQLLITVEYDPDAISGPPFSVPLDLVADLHGSVYNVTTLETAPVSGNFAARVSGSEHVTLLRKHSHPRSESDPSE